MSPHTSLVVGVDFTPCSAVALGQAIRIAGWSAGSSIHVVHVIDTLVVIEAQDTLKTVEQEIGEGLLADGQAAWASFAASVDGAAALPVQIAINNRVFGILKVARERRADLLVLGAFGERKADVGVGTVATGCVRHGGADVLLVRDTQPGPFRTVVVAVDFSDTSRRALERAAFVAAREGAELHVLHVVQALRQRLRFTARAAEAAAQQQEQYRGVLAQRLADFAGPVVEQHAGLRARHELFDHSGHRSGIIEYAEKAGADLIVLGTRGRTNLRDIFLGSTAEKALGESRCSILAVKPADATHPSTTA